MARWQNRQAKAKPSLPTGRAPAREPQLPRNQDVRSMHGGSAASLPCALTGQLCHTFPVSPARKHVGRVNTMRAVSLASIWSPVWTNSKSHLSRAVRGSRPRRRCGTERFSPHTDPFPRRSIIRSNLVGVKLVANVTSTPFNPISSLEQHPLLLQGLAPAPHLQKACHAPWKIASPSIIISAAGTRSTVSSPRPSILIHRDKHLRAKWQIPKGGSSLIPATRLAF